MNSKEKKFLDETSAISNIARMKWDIWELVWWLIPDRPWEPWYETDISNHHGWLVKCLVNEAEHNLLVSLLACFEEYSRLRSSWRITLEEIMKFHYDSQKRLKSRIALISATMYDLKRTDHKERTYIEEISSTSRHIWYLLVASLFNWNRDNEYQQFASYNWGYMRNHWDWLSIWSSPFRVPDDSIWRSYKMNSEIYVARMNHYFTRVIEFMSPSFFQELNEQWLI